jgi:cysteine desulfurase
VVARSAKSISLPHGRGQERSLRSGTMNYSLAASFAAAAKEAIAELDHEAARLGALKDQMEALVMEAVPSAIITALGANRAAYNAHFIFPGTQSDGMLFLVGSKRAFASPRGRHARPVCSVPHMFYWAWASVNHRHQHGFG